jgi:hypothetical protein
MSGGRHCWRRRRVSRCMQGLERLDEFMNLGAGARVENGKCAQCFPDVARSREEDEDVTSVRGVKQVNCCLHGVR